MGKDVSTPARTCFPEKGGKQADRPVCWRSTLDLVRAGEQKSAEGDGLALASPLRTRGHLLETTKMPLRPSHHIPRSKIKYLSECKAGKEQHRFE